MQRLKEENSPSSCECEKQIAELTYCLMYQHAGYPEIYEPVLAALKVRKAVKKGGISFSLYQRSQKEKLPSMPLCHAMSYMEGVVVPQIFVVFLRRTFFHALNGLAMIFAGQKTYLSSSEARKYTYISKQITKSPYIC